MMDKGDTVAASGMVSSSVLAALMQMLVIKGTLSAEEVRDIYDAALFMLEKQQAEAGPSMNEIYGAARSVIEDMLQR